MYDKTCLIKRFRQEGNTMDKKWQRRRKRLFEILEIGSDLDAASRIYDFVSAFAIVINIIASVMYTYDHLRIEYGKVLITIEHLTVAFFAIDYILRVLLLNSYTLRKRNQKLFLNMYFHLME